MSKQEKGDVNVNIAINFDAIESALENSQNIEEAEIKFNTLNPLDLNLRQTIYGIRLNPITNKVTKLGRTPVQPVVAKYPSIEKIVVNNIGVHPQKEGVVVINGLIEAPETVNRSCKLADLYLDNYDDAAVVCDLISAVQFKKNEDTINRLMEEQEFLKEQRANKRW